MLSTARVLRLNKCGVPIGWVSQEKAATLVVKECVIWSLGEHRFVLYGGINHQGVQSRLELPSIIACSGQVKSDPFCPPLENCYLFRRDHHICLYCGNSFHPQELSRDHIIPKSQGGKDVWTNLVTACRKCNHRKANRTPEQANMPLLAVPFRPNRFEFLYLANRKILADQMEFLQQGFKKQTLKAIN